MLTDRYSEHLGLSQDETLCGTPSPFKLPFSIPVLAQHKLEAALLALGQFQHALAELMAWLTHTEELLDAQKPINGDPKVIEVELAKHHVSVFPLQIHF